MIRYILRIKELDQTTINIYLNLNFIYNSKPTAVGCSLYNRLPIYMNRIETTAVMKGN